MDFLTTAANNFKYSFQEQLLIFAQKPDATACAEVSWWNKHCRWVNRNTKGIALLVDTDAPYKLRHVFDVSDTNSRVGKEVPIWKMEQRFIEPVKNVLAERYEVDAQESLEDCLLNVAVTFVNDNYQDYLAELMEAKAGSLLEKLDEDNTRLQMLTALGYSVGYMLHIRCGLPGRAYFGNSLDKVCNFNTPEVISILGAAVSDMSEVLLREIAVLALSQLGNVGGQPYWSWYGFTSRVEWCACFVSWCANECGYIDAGVIPSFSLCSDGSDWFKARSQWQERDYEPCAGDIIFFDWGGDGIPDHVGIVEKTEGGTVYTVEGNSGDACRENSYPVGDARIYGYGVPMYS